MNFKRSAFIVLLVGAFGLTSFSQQVQNAASQKPANHKLVKGRKIYVKGTKSETKNVASEKKGTATEKKAADTRKKPTSQKKATNGTKTGH
jgi:hypothetical protein